MANIIHDNSPEAQEAQQKAEWEEFEAEQEHLANIDAKGRAEARIRDLERTKTKTGGKHEKNNTSRKKA